MTREEAQEILRGYRPGPTNSADAKLQEALEQTKSDPELHRWFAELQEFHVTVRGELRGLSPPAGLRESILADHRARSRFRPSGAALALAALLAVVLGGVAFWAGGPIQEARDLANFQSRMTSFVQRTYQMDVVSRDGKAVREYLLNHGAPADFELPPRLAQLPVKGGGRLSWHNHPVGMMCFEMPSREMVFMFVVDPRDVAGLSLPLALTTTSTNDISVATWTRGNRLHLVAANVRPEVLGELVGDQQ